MTSENKKQGDGLQLPISSPPSAEELASLHVQSREYDGGVPSYVHCPISGEWDPNISWMDAALRELDDIPGPWNTGNQFIQGSNAAASGHKPITGELAANDLAMTGAAQPNCGVDFLGLGCGINGESDPKWDINHPACEQLTGRVLLPLFNTSPDKTISRSSLNYSSNMAYGSPGFPQHAGGHRQLRNEDPYRAPSLGQNAIGFPHQVWGANQLTNPVQMQNVEGSLKPDFNIGRLSHQAPILNRDNAGVTSAAWFRATRMPSPPSMVRFPQPASDQLQNPPITSLRNLSPWPSMAPPFVGISGNMSRHIQSGPVAVPSCSGEPRTMLSHGQRGPIVVPSLGSLKSMPWQGQSGQAVPANTGSAVENDVRVQHTSKGFLDQSGAWVSLNPLNNTHAHANTSDHGIQQINVPQLSVSHSVPSLKRVAPKLVPVAPAAQRKKTRSTIHPSPSVPPHVPPSSLDSLKPHMSRLLQNQALLHSLLTTHSTDHIKWQEEDETSPSGYQCPICKRDLSYTPEGPAYQLDKLKSTSVLPCGHFFHSSCLLHITPTDQAENPPCIPCALEG